MLGPAVERPGGAGFHVLDVETELGGEADPVPARPGQRPADQLFVLVGAVDLGGVDQGDPPVHGLLQGREAFGLVRPALVGEAHAHAAEAQRRDFEALPAQLACVHGEILLNHTLTPPGQPTRIRGSLSGRGTQAANGSRL